MSKKKLTEIISGGRECVMDPPTDAAIWHSICYNLGTAYVGGPLEALKESISNAADSEARKIVLNLKRKGKNPRVEVIDNGKGMYLPKSEEALIDRAASEFTALEIMDDSILRLPKKIGDSAKRLDPTKQGEKAIGALAWLSLGNNVAFLSRKEGHETVGWTCTHTKEGDDHKLSSAICTEADTPGLADLVEDNGTKVIFTDIHHDVVKLLNPRRIQKDLGSRFRDLLKDGVSITIKDENGTYEVQPEEYQGRLISLETVSTPRGDISFEIYFNPNMKGQVHIKQGIQTLIEDIKTKGEYLESSAWGSGFFCGQIKADWLAPGAGRQDLDNADAEIFFNAVSKYSGKLEETIAKYRETTDVKKLAVYYKTMGKAFRQMVTEDEAVRDLLSGYRTSKKGKPVPGQPAEGFSPDAPNPPGDGTGEGGSGGSGDGTAPASGQGTKPIDRSKPGTTPGRKAATLRFADEEFQGPEASQLSRFEEEYSRMVFNSAHPFYLVAIEKTETRAAYLAGLTAKELLRSKSNEAAAFADDVIEFQTRFMGYFKG